MKFVLFRCDTGKVTTLSLGYDDCRRPRRGFLCVGSVTKTLIKRPARRASEWPEAEVFRIEDDVHSEE